MKNKLWIAVFAAAALICIAVICFLRPGGGSIAEISQGGEMLYRIDLSREVKPRDIRIEAEDGGYNIIHIEGGAISVTEADCPDKICIKQGSISGGGAPIVCLPHKLIIRIEGSGETDAVTGR